MVEHGTCVVGVSSAPTQMLLLDASSSSRSTTATRRFAVCVNRCAQVNQQMALLCSHESTEYGLGMEVV